MRQFLLPILLFATLRLSAQLPCPPTETCTDAPLVCGYVLHGYINRLPDNPTGNATFCFSWHNSHWFRIAACSSEMLLSFTPSNCITGNGIQAALYEDIGDCQPGNLVEITCDPGVTGGAGNPVFIGATNLTPGKVYLLQIDGFQGDVCDYQILVQAGLSTSPPVPGICTNCQPGFIDGPDQFCKLESPTFTLHLPTCQKTGGGGGGDCSDRDECVELQWNLPPGAQILGDPTASSVQVDFTNVAPGTYPISVTENDHCNPCPSCSAGDVGCQYIMLPKTIKVLQPIPQVLPPVSVCFENWPPDVISDDVVFGSNNITFFFNDTTNCRIKRQTYSLKPQIFSNLGQKLICPGDSFLLCSTWLKTPGFYSETCQTPAGCDSTATVQLAFKTCLPAAPDTCANLNQPAPPGDSCSVAPLFCGNYLQNYCSRNAGFSPDIPAGLDTSLFVFEIENNAWLRFTPCEDTVWFKFSVDDCQNGQGLETALLGGDCDSLQPLQFAFYQPDITATTNFTGLTPGDTYYIMVDGQQGDVCDFSIEILSGIGTDTPPPAPTGTCVCTDGKVTGDDDLCPGDMPTYSIQPPNCTFIADPPLPGSDTLEYCLPTGYDCGASSGTDSTWVVWHLPPYMHFIGDSTGLTIDTWVDSTFLGLDTIRFDTIWVEFFTLHIPDSAALDSLVFCDCTPALGCLAGIRGLPIKVSHNTSNEHIGTLTCVVTAIEFEGKIYTSPGKFLHEQTGCKTRFVTVNQNITPPFIAASPVDLGNGSFYQVFVSVLPSFALVSPPSGSIFPCGSSYQFIATDPSNGCTAEASGFFDCQAPCPQPIPVNIFPPAELSCCNPTVELAYSTSTQIFQTSWSGPGGFVNNAGGGITVSTPGVYTVIVFDPTGCSGSASATVTADYRIPNLDLSPNPPICLGQSVSIKATTDAATPATFFWNTGAFAANINVTPSQTTTYSCTVTDPTNCCTNSASTTVTVNQPTTVDLGTVGSLSCTQPCLDFQGKTYCQTGDFEISDSCRTTRFRLDFQRDTVDLGLAATLSCAAPCFIFQNQNFCSAGDFEITDSCRTTHFRLDFQRDTVDLGLAATLSCAQPCFVFQNQNFCSAGDFEISDSCRTMRFRLDFQRDTVDLGLAATLSCAQPCFIFQNQNFCTTGSFETTDSCRVTRFSLDADSSLTPVALSPVTICKGTCFNFFGQNVCTDTLVSVIQNCEILSRQIVVKQPKTDTLGIVGAVSCGKPIFKFDSLNYTKPGIYVTTDTATCTAKRFEIIFQKDSADLGLLATLTCDVPDFTRGGQTYSAPGTYFDADSCSVFKFEILENKTAPQTSPPQHHCLPSNTAYEVRFAITGQAPFRVNGQALTGNLFLSPPVASGQPYLFSVKNEPNGCETAVSGVWDCDLFCTSSAGTMASDTIFLCHDGVSNVTALGATILDPDDTCEYIMHTYPTNEIGQIMQRSFSAEIKFWSGQFVYNQVYYISKVVGNRDANGQVDLDDPCLSVAPGQPVIFYERPAVSLGPDLTVPFGQPVTLTGTSNRPADVLQWTSTAGGMHDSSLVWTFVVTQEQSVTLEIRDTLGCTGYDVLLIRLAAGEGIFAPNVIQPGSTANGRFTLFTDPDYPLKINWLRVFDRWGNLVFENSNFDPNNLDEGWDGQSRGKRALPGVYVFAAEVLLPGGEKKVLEGEVTVLR